MPAEPRLTRLSTIVLAAGLAACTQTGTPPATSAQQPQELEPLTGNDLERFRACVNERFQSDPELAATVAEGGQDDPRTAQIAADCHREVSQDP